MNAWKWMCWKWMPIGQSLTNEGWGSVDKYSSFIIPHWDTSEGYFSGGPQQNWTLATLRSHQSSNTCPFFKKNIYFNWRLITLQYYSGFLPYMTWVSHECTCVPHPIPQGHSSAPALSTLSHASNLDWWSISHMIIYIFQCYSLKSSHPCLLPKSPKVCSLPLSLLLSHIYSHLTIFLNFLYMC